MKMQKKDRVLGKFLKFILVGAALSGVHLGVSWGLIYFNELNLLPANMIAFLAANVISFFINSRWTFKASISIIAYVRFFIVSISGFLVVFIGSLLSVFFGLSDFLGSLFIVCVLPGVSFLAHKKWTFK